MLKALKLGKGDMRQNQFDEMRRELLAHAKAEEAEFYPVLRNAEETRDLAEDAIDDHARIEDLLDRLSEMDVDSESFSEVCDELIAEVEDHVQMEEKELIPAAQRIIDDERAKELLYNLGSIAEAQGNREEARSFFVRIYEIDIGYRDVAAKMGTLR